MLDGTGVTLAPAAVRVSVAAAAATLCAVLALALSPVIAVVSLLAVVTLLFGASVAALGAGRWLPVAVPAFAAASALLGGQLARFFYQERKRVRIQLAFGHYLAPSIVAQLSESEEEIKLGGEIRDVTVIFADLTGFTATSDTMGPAELMELTNRYFKVMVESIDEHGGYVDKFIGDSVMAIWGAPTSIADAPGKALDCCFDILQRVKALRESRTGIDPAGFDVKVGVASGPAIVGNVGSPSRLSYTALRRHHQPRGEAREGLLGVRMSHRRGRGHDEPAARAVSLLRARRASRCAASATSSRCSRPSRRPRPPRRSSANTRRATRRRCVRIASGAGRPRRSAGSRCRLRMARAAARSPPS